MTRLGNRVRVGFGASFGISTPTLPNVGTLQLRLRGDLGYVRNGNDLQSIADQSGNGRNYQQTTASKQPLHNGALINGRQAIGDFNGSTDALVKFAGADITGGTYTIFAVVDMTLGPDGTAQSIIDWATGRLQLAGQAGTAGTDDTVVFDGSSLLGGFDAVNGPQILTVDVNGASSKLFRGGVQLGSTFSIGAVNLGGASGIGANNAGTAGFFNGLVGEIVVYGPRLSDANREIARTAYLSPSLGV